MASPSSLHALVHLKLLVTQGEGVMIVRGVYQSVTFFFFLVVFLSLSGIDFRSSNANSAFLT